MDDLDTMGEMDTGSTGLCVGWAAASITPDRPVQLQGQFFERVSEYVRDPIMATALALEASDGCEQAVIVSCDLTDILDAVQSAVQRRVGETVPGLNAQKVILVATHTHTAPMTRGGFFPEPDPGVMRPDEYVGFLVDRIVDAVAQAWENRVPGRVSWALGHAVVGFNRRPVFAGGRVKMYGDTETAEFEGLEGCHDPGVELLFTYDVAGQLTGMIINPACPSQTVMLERFVSADYWSAVRENLRAQYGPELFILPLCSAAGDQCPRDLVRRGRGGAAGHDEAGLLEMGRRISRAVEEVLDGRCQDIQTHMPFRHAVERLSLPARRITPEQAADMRAELEERQAASDQGRTNRIRKLRLQQALAQVETQPENPQYEMELHVIRLGDIALATNPFELFLDYGLRIKARSSAEQTFIAQLACGRGCYLPTAKGAAGGGYSALVPDSPVGPAGGQVLVERTLELMNEMWR